MRALALTPWRWVPRASWITHMDYPYDVFEFDLDPPILIGAGRAAWGGQIGFESFAKAPWLCRARRRSNAYWHVESHSRRVGSASGNGLRVLIQLQYTSTIIITWSVQKITCTNMMAIVNVTMNVPESTLTCSTSIERLAISSQLQLHPAVNQTRAFEIWQHPDVVVNGAVEMKGSDYSRNRDLLWRSSQDLLSLNLNVWSSRALLVSFTCSSF